MKMDMYRLFMTNKKTVNVVNVGLDFMSPQGSLDEILDYEH